MVNNKIMKALKSDSVQTLIIGIVLCSLMYKFTDEITLPTIFASAFTALVVGNKVRSNIQSSKGQYYDKEENKLKEVK